MSVTRLQLRDRVYSRLALTEDDGLLSPDDVNQAINDGLQAMATEFSWPWLQLIATTPTIIGTNSYAMPANSTRISTVSIDGRVLDVVQYEDYVRYFDMQGAYPNVFTTVGDSILVAPTPSSLQTMTILYVRSEPFLDDDADTALVPDQYADVAVTYACISAAIRLQDTNRINVLMGYKDEQMRRISDNVQRTQIAPMIRTRKDV